MTCFSINLVSDATNVLLSLNAILLIRDFLQSKFVSKNFEILVISLWLTTLTRLK